MPKAHKKWTDDDDLAFLEEDELMLQQALKKMKGDSSLSEKKNEEDENDEPEAISLKDLKNQSLNQRKTERSIKTSLDKEKKRKQKERSKEFELQKKRKIEAFEEQKEEGQQQQQQEEEEGNEEEEEQIKLRKKARGLLPENISVVPLSSTSDKLLNNTSPLDKIVQKNQDENVAQLKELLAIHFYGSRVPRQDINTFRSATRKGPAIVFKKKEITKF